MGVGGSAPRPGRLYPRERPGIHCTGGWVGPRAGLKGGKSRPHQDSIPDRPARSSVAIPTELPRPRTLLNLISNLLVKSVSSSEGRRRISHCKLLVFPFWISMTFENFLGNPYVVHNLASLASAYRYPSYLTVKLTSSYQTNSTTC